MRKLRLRKKMLTTITLVYAVVLAASVVFAAVTGQIDFTGEIRTSADLDVVINPNPTSIVLLPPSGFGSSVLSATPSADGKSMTVVVDLRAPGDVASFTFEFMNAGRLPAEFETPEVIMRGIPAYTYVLDQTPDSPTFGEEIRTPLYDTSDPPQRVYEYPVEIDDYIEIGEVLGFNDIDGYWLMGGVGNTSTPFGISFMWDDDIHHVTHPDGPNGPGTPLTFEIHFPYGIGDIEPPPTPTPTPDPDPAP